MVGLALTKCSSGQSYAPTAFAFASLILAKAVSTALCHLTQRYITTRILIVNFMKYKILGVILSLIMAGCGGDNLHADDDPFTGHWLSSCLPLEIIGGSVASGSGFYFIHELKLTAETVNESFKVYEDSACEDFFYGDALALSGKPITDVEELISENGYEYNKYTYLNSEGNSVP